MSSEYSNSSVNQSPCSYATLGSYGGSAWSAAGPSNSIAAPVQGYYVVPAYSASGYNTLTHGLTTPGCSGYFTMKNAYTSANGAGCNMSYVAKTCM